MLSKLKTLLGISGTTQDTKLNAILNSVQSRLCILINEESVPEALEDIVVDVSVIRFNRIGSEGLGSHSVEGESMSFGANDFDGYMSEIQAWVNAKDENKTGKVRFL